MLVENSNVKHGAWTYIISKAIIMHIIRVGRHARHESGLRFKPSLYMSDKCIQFELKIRGFLESAGRLVLLSRGSKYMNVIFKADAFQDK